jgi:hypothetical protein
VLCLAPAYKILIAKKAQKSAHLSVRRTSLALYFSEVFVIDIQGLPWEGLPFAYPARTFSVLHHFKVDGLSNPVLLPKVFIAYSLQECLYH